MDRQHPSSAAGHGGQGCGQREPRPPSSPPPSWPCSQRPAAAQPVIHRFRRLIKCREGQSAPRQRAPSRSPSPTACVPTACRTFPDPTRRGGVPKVTPQQVGVSNLPVPGGPESLRSTCSEPTQAQVPQIMSGMLNFARCMRSHGVPNWPDPSTDSSGQPVFSIPGINPDSLRISNTANECTHLLVQSTTGPTTIQLCNGIGEDARVPWLRAAAKQLKFSKRTRATRRCTCPTGPPIAEAEGTEMDRE